MVFTRTYTIATLALSGLFAASFVYGQIIPDPLSLAANPSSPSPNQRVTVAANTPTFDKDTAYFSWTVDGTPRPDLSGQGKSSFFLTAGAVGSSVRASVFVERDAGGSLTGSIVIKTVDLALPWFADTLVPRWYKGKALPIPESIVTIVALPQFGSGLKPENLIYRWGLDDQEDILVGAGKQTFRVKTSDLPDTSHHVTVTVENINKDIQKKGEVFIVSGNPLVNIYPSSPLGGIESRSAGSVIATVKRGLFDFAAEPFFLNISSKKTVPFLWTAGGLETTGLAKNPDFLTLDITGLPAGSVPISVSVANVSPILSKITKAITLLLQ